jgi:hypothetical protein
MKSDPADKVFFLDPNTDIDTIAQVIFQHEMEKPEGVAWFAKLVASKRFKTVFVSAFTAGIAATLRALEDGSLHRVGRG